MDVSTLTNGKLVKLLEKRACHLSSLTLGVFELAKSPNDGFADILKANPTAKAAVAYEKARRELDEAKDEARNRVGPVQFDMTSTFITYLQNQKGLRKRRA